MPSSALTALMGTLGQIFLGVIEFILSVGGFFPLAILLAYLGDQSPAEVRSKKLTLKFPRSSNIWTCFWILVGIHLVVTFVVALNVEPFYWALLSSVLGVHAVILAILIGVGLLCILLGSLDLVLEKYGLPSLGGITKSEQAPGYEAVATDVQEHELEQGPAGNDGKSGQVDEDDEELSAGNERKP